jgi:hypothetical protein
VQLLHIIPTQFILPLLSGPCEDEPSPPPPPSLSSSSLSTPPSGFIVGTPHLTIMFHGIPDHNIWPSIRSPVVKPTTMSGMIDACHVNAARNNVYAITTHVHCPLLLPPSPAWERNLFLGLCGVRAGTINSIQNNKHSRTFGVKHFRTGWA